MPTPPISHYKDEPVDQATQDLVSQEIEKEAVSKTEAEPTPAPELKVLPVKKQEKKTNASNIVNAFRQKMSSNTTPIELPSVGKTIHFKEITTAEQKELARLSLESESRTDVMFCAMVAMINKLATEPGFDIRDYTEFERIYIILNLQQLNKINPEIKYTCANCGKENSYTLDTAKVLRNFAKTYKADETFEQEYGNRKFSFVAGWPGVREVEAFFKNYYKKYDNLGKKVKDTMNNMSQIEYVTMFLKKITVTELSDPDDMMVVNLEELTYPERVQIIDCLPQGILFDDDTGVVSKLVEEFVNPLNDVFKYHDCAFCGAEQNGAVANVTDFLGY